MFHSDVWVVHQLLDAIDELEAERDEARAQLATLREAAQALVETYNARGRTEDELFEPEWWAPLLAALEKVGGK
jgi:hypothetical protein